MKAKHKSIWDIRFLIIKFITQSEFFIFKNKFKIMYEEVLQILRKIIYFTQEII